MYRRILFAVDDDEALPAAVPVVTEYARRSAAAVRVVHVHRFDMATSNGHDRRLVRSVTDRLESAGVHAEGEVRLLARKERVGTVIARVAEQSGADLVVVGSHGRSDLGALFRGSVGHDLAAVLDTPVLVLRCPPLTAAEPRTILVPVDGSPGADQAVAEAGDIAMAFGAEVIVLHGRLVITAQSGAVVEPQEDAQTILSRATTALEARGIRVRTRTVLTHSAATSVATTAEQTSADLVVLGSRRPSDLEGLLLGSTAHEVVHLLRCPVLLARRVGGPGRADRPSVRGTLIAG
jgi:nucleotide-binding universal stress UspA family protein